MSIHKKALEELLENSAVITPKWAGQYFVHLQIPLDKYESAYAALNSEDDSHAELVAALETAIAQFDFTVAAMAKGQKVSISSLQNCAANARAALAKAQA